MIEQIAIGVLGAGAAFLSQDTKPERRRFACLFGLAGQPFWFYTTYQSQQWGMFALSILYAIAWVRGFATHWLWRRA
ncbi:hypothetical protein LMG24238_06926 [Paraburkholderia sediminicola]|uniref:Nicotinamide riboside transporter PnuC n=1 Tax=Paraburkholderia sediminicola TaxID=458836 RepID=A0A6J5CP32_9BURK|nr:hypothetical protein [Paraburkholderia sediminicola]CAB3742705.1 hypothetical protein LMG24238_06926 [Paraburkholderia sediminicola]